MVAQDQGFFSLSRACPTCGGEGTIIKDRCRTCGGTGSLPQEKTVTVRIPPGINSGGKLKYKGLGQAGHRGARAGDLFIIIQVKEHSFFKRFGSNIHIDVPLSFTEAALGGKVKVPVVNGSVSLKIPGGTQSGQTFRIKGKGFPKMRAKGDGDMMAKVSVIVPSDLQPSQKELLVRLADQTKGDPRSQIEKLAKAP